MAHTATWKPEDVTSDETKDTVLWSLSLSNNKKIHFCSWKEHVSHITIWQLEQWWHTAAESLWENVMTLGSQCLDAHAHCMQSPLLARCYGSKDAQQSFQSLVSASHFWYIVLIYVYVWDIVLSPKYKIIKNTSMFLRGSWSPWENKMYLVHRNTCGQHSQKETPERNCRDTQLKTPKTL